MTQFIPVAFLLAVTPVGRTQPPPSAVRRARSSMHTVADGVSIEAFTNSQPGLVSFCSVNVPDPQ